MLARFSSAPTQHHLTGVQNIFQYLMGTIDMGLFYPYSDKKHRVIASSDCHVTPACKNPCVVLIGFADAGYLGDPHKGHSQTGYVFTMGNTAISWRSTKQTVVATSSNHTKIITLHEAVCECIWLRAVITHVRGSSGIGSTIEELTCIYEDNAV